MKYIKILIFVLVLGTVSGSLLVGVNSFTKPIIEKNEELKLKRSILDAVEISYTREDIEDIFSKNIKTVERDGFIYYRSPDGAVAFGFRGPGLWGPMSGTISLNPGLKTIRRIRILHQEETPGLGGRVGEEAFLSQFSTKEIFPSIILTPPGKAAAKNEVDAITGATGTSRAFEKLLNENLQRYVKLIKE